MQSHPTDSHICFQMCMAGEDLHALLPADTQFPQQQLKTQNEISLSASPTNHQGSKAKYVRYFNHQTGSDHTKKAALVYTKTEFSAQCKDLSIMGYIGVLKAYGIQSSSTTATKQAKHLSVSVHKTVILNAQGTSRTWNMARL